MNQLYLNKCKILQILFDRMCIRYKDTTMPSVLWHRDIGKTAPDNDIFLGGWINVGHTNQYFSCKCWGSKKKL